MSTREAAHVDALWWLFTAGGFSFSIHEPRPLGPIEYVVIIGEAKNSFTYTFKAPTREELLDRLVAFKVERRLAP